jgi:hypothetical protein
MMRSTLVPLSTPPELDPLELPLELVDPLEVPEPEPELVEPLEVPEPELVEPLELVDPLELPEPEPELVEPLEVPELELVEPLEVPEPELAEPLEVPELELVEPLEVPEPLALPEPVDPLDPPELPPLLPAPESASSLPGGWLAQATASHDAAARSATLRARKARREGRFMGSLGTGRNGANQRLRRIGTTPKRLTEEAAHGRSGSFEVGETGGDAGRQRRLAVSGTSAFRRPCSQDGKSCSARPTTSYPKIAFGLTPCLLRS